MGFGDFIGEFWQKVSRNFLAFVAIAWRAAVKFENPTLWAPMLGLGASYAINGYIYHREYKFALDRVRRTYAPEIAAKLGKNEDSLTRADVLEMAQVNPVIAAAVRRHKTNRNIDFFSSIIAVTLAVVAATALLSLLPGAGILASGAISLGVGLATYFAAEKIVEPLARRRMGYSEPSLEDVLREPRLQPELSLPSQILYLEQKQKLVRLREPGSWVTTGEVMTAFLAANPLLAQQVESRYGAAFAMLPEDKRSQVIDEMEPQLGIAQMTRELNRRTVRAQEVAFAAAGQVSGVAPLVTPQLTALERAEQHLAATREKLGHLTTQAREHAAYYSQAAVDRGRDAMEAARSKMPFAKSKVSGVVPQNQQAVQSALAASETALLPPPPPEAPLWVDRVPAPYEKSKAAEIVTRRQLQAGDLAAATP